MTPDTFQLLPPEEDDDDLEEDVPDEDDEEVEQDEGDDEDEETWQVGASSSRVPRSGFGVRVCSNMDARTRNAEQQAPPFS